MPGEWETLRVPQVFHPIPVGVDARFLDKTYLTASTQRETTNIHTHIDNYSRFRVANHLIVASPLTVKGKQSTQRGATQTGSTGRICKTVSVSIQLYLYGTIL